MTGAVLRPARVADLPLIDRLCADSIAHRERGIGYPRCDNAGELLAELADYAGNTLERNVFVVLNAGRPIGFTALLVDDSDAQTYVAGPLLAPGCGQPGVYGEVLRAVRARLPPEGEVRNCIDDANSALARALAADGWRPGPRLLEMRCALPARAVPPAGTGAHAVLRPTTGGSKLPAIAELFGSQHGWNTSVASHRDRLAAHLDHGWHVAHVERGGQLAGAVLWAFVDGTDVCRLEYLSVAGASRRRGVGSALVQHVLSDAHRHGFQWVYISTGLGNVGAQALFVANGFEETVVSVLYILDRG